jgi:hypothetical protein
LNPFATVTGKVYMSEDAIGTNDPAGGPIKVHKADSSATVQAAYLLAAGIPSYTMVDGDVTLNGTALSFPASNNVVGNFAVNSVWTDVTSIVKPVVDSAAPGDVQFTAAEPNNTDSIDGEILAVILNDPTLPTNNTVSFQFGALNTAGDTYSIGLASPLNLSDPNLALTMSIGDSYGYQGPPATGQYSQISVNGSLMTSSAGGNDDAVVKYDTPPDYANAGNGELITVGGIGDDAANPPDPKATDSDCAGGPPRCDDELYNLLPFVHNGDSSITVNTNNPSANDNIFFTGFQLNSTAAVVGAGAVLTPVSGTSPVGSSYTFTTKVQDNGGNPVANQSVTFTVLSGPNAGQSTTAVTNASGIATDTYTSSSAGTDTVQVSFTDATNTHQVSNQATVTWTPVAANHPPVATNVSATTPQDTPANLTLTASDADGDSLAYAVVTNPSHGTLSGTAPNLTYTPNAGYTGPDSFTFKANDGQADSNTAAASITVTAVNRPPVANPQSVSTAQDTPVNVTLAGSDPDGDAITYVVVGSPAHGTLSGTAPNLTYTPNSGYSGPDSFTFKTNDGKLDSPVATVSITVTPTSPTCPTSAPSVDTVVSTDQKTAASTLVSHAITTSHAGELILAFIEVDGPTAPTQQVTSMTGGGLTWTLAARANETWGSTEVWQAYATSTLSSVKVTAKLAKSGYDGSITVAAFSGAAKTVGAIATNAATKGAPSATLIPATCNGLIWAAGHDWSRAVNPVPASSQVIVHKFIDTRVHDSFWTQSVVSTTTIGTAVTVADTGPVKDRWTLAAVEIPAG